MLDRNIRHQKNVVVLISATSYVPSMEMPTATTDHDQLVADLRKAGVAVVADAIEPRDVRWAREQLVALAAHERDAGTALRDDGTSASGDYTSGANQRIVSLLDKDRAFWPLVLAPAPRRAASELFGDSYGYPADVVRQYRLDAVILSSITANIASLGGRPMPLHADQGFAPSRTPMPLLLNVVWPLDDFTADNGATRVVPGSHVRRTDEAGTVEVDATPVEAPAGSAILIDGRTWHGTGANQTPDSRHAVLTTYCRPWVRPFANHMLDLSDETLAAAPAELIELVGARSWFVYGASERLHLAGIRA
jgi:ectoine hydroxylase-related dioxygenase (phytanoyl-CoA dioxygenase family)